MIKERRLHMNKEKTHNISLAPNSNETSFHLRLRTFEPYDKYRSRRLYAGVHKLFRNY